MDFTLALLLRYEVIALCGVWVDSIAIGIFLKKTL
jgi:hypothetical protein